MSDVGDLLELLHGAFDRWETARFTLRRWHHTARNDVAMERWLAHTGHSRHRQLFGEGERPETWEHIERVWIAKPDRFRQEFDQHLTVHRGGTFWSYSPHHGYSSNAEDADTHVGDFLQGYALHLDPSSILPQANFERLDETQVLARSRPTFHHGLPHGADDHLLTIDPRRGVVLRVESRIDGEPFAIAEIQEASWDESFDDGLFTIELPPGRRWRSPREHHGHVTLEEAAERASFAVFAIDELPDGNWRLDVHHHAELGENVPEAVTLLYHRADGREHLQIHEHAVGTSHPWSRLQGAQFFVAERDETRITLQSEHFTEDELRALADRLVRV